MMTGEDDRSRRGRDGVSVRRAEMEERLRKKVNRNRGKCNSYTQAQMMQHDDREQQSTHPLHAEAPSHQIRYGYEFIIIQDLIL